MGANVNDILDPAIFLGAANVLFGNEDLGDLVDLVGILEDERDERENHHERVRNFFEEVIPLYSLSGCWSNRRQQPTVIAPIIWCFGATHFKSHLRLTRQTFRTFLDDIGPLLNRHHMGPQRICPEKQLCIAIWIFANQEVYRSVADRFGVSKNTAWRCTINVAQVLNNQSHNYIIWPVGPQLVQVEEDFERQAGFPGVVGAVDGCHIEISAPHVDAESYVNRKHYHSVVLQGICDAKRKFIDVFAGVCGSVHDARIWRMSDIQQAMLNQGEVYCPRETHTLGDSAYPIQYDLLPPYRDNGHLTPTQRHFNTIHSKTRVVIERAFGLLKGRFRRLKYLYVQHVQYAPLIIIACCVLHNICLDLDDELNDLVADGNDDVGTDVIGDHNGRDIIPGANKRDIIADLLMDARRNRQENH